MAEPANWLKRLLGTGTTPPKLPDGVCVYAIGDIHGRFDLTHALLEKIWSDAPTGRNTLVFLGDYIDRGPASRDVIDHLIRLTRPGWEIVLLAGNHEVSLLEFLKSPEIYPTWRTFGGAETLISYGVRPPVFSDAEAIAAAHQKFVTAFPRAHLDFLTRLSNFYELGDYFFVHAGVRPGIRLEDQVPEDLLWIRDEFLDSEKSFGKVIVHGHTPAERPVVRANRIGIDTGAYATNCLTALKLIGDKHSFLSTSAAQSP